MIVYGHIVYHEKREETTTVYAICEIKRTDCGVFKASEGYHVGGRHCHGDGQQGGLHRKL